MSKRGDGGWYTPADQWPRHNATWFRDALGYARSKQWHLREHSGHSFGTAYCSHPHDVDLPCKFTVFSSGRAGEDAARELRRLVDNCPHLQHSERASLQRGRQIIAKVETLLAAASFLLGRDELADQAAEAWARAEELIELAEDSVDEVAELMQEAEAYEAQAGAATLEARDVLQPLGLLHLGPRAIADLAGREAQQASAEVEQLPAAPAAEDLRERIAMARASLEELHTRLEYNA
jgi:hypothetical protein